jgi:hypothetical protein
VYNNYFKEVYKLNRKKCIYEFIVVVYEYIDRRTYLMEYWARDRALGQR